MRLTPSAPSGMNLSQAVSVKSSVPCWSCSTSWTALTPWAMSRCVHTLNMMIFKIKCQKLGDL